MRSVADRIDGYGARAPRARGRRVAWREQNAFLARAVLPELRRPRALLPELRRRPRAFLPEVRRRPRARLLELRQRPRALLPELRRASDFVSPGFVPARPRSHRWTVPRSTPRPPSPAQVNRIRTPISLFPLSPDGRNLSRSRSPTALSVSLFLPPSLSLPFSHPPFRFPLPPTLPKISPSPTLPLSRDFPLCHPPSLSRVPTLPVPPLSRDFPPSLFPPLCHPPLPPSLFLAISLPLCFPLSVTVPSHPPSLSSDTLLNSCCCEKLIAAADFTCYGKISTMNWALYHLEIGHSKALKVSKSACLRRHGRPSLVVILRVVKKEVEDMNYKTPWDASARSVHSFSSELHGDANLDWSSMFSVIPNAFDADC
ncbi:hypothetical protein ACLOJK_027713 [Asimina triloba]